MGQEDFCALSRVGKWWNPNFLALAPRTGSGAARSVCIPRAPQHWHVVRSENIVIPPKMPVGHSQVSERERGWHMESLSKCPQLHPLPPSPLCGYILTGPEQDLLQGALQRSAWLDLTAGAGWRCGDVSVAAPAVIGHGHLWLLTLPHATTKPPVSTKHGQGSSVGDVPCAQLQQPFCDCALGLSKLTHWFLIDYFLMQRGDLKKKD